MIGKGKRLQEPDSQPVSGRESEGERKASSVSRPQPVYRCRGSPAHKCQRGTEEAVNAPGASGVHGTTDKDTASLLNQPVNDYMNERMCE